LNFYKPKISIVTPCYNSAKFIERLHRSLTLQDFKDFEWVVVDDCSTDETVERISRFEAPGFGGIQLFRLPQNSGGGVANGFAFEKSRAELIIMIDHDDELFETALSRAATQWKLIENRADCAGLFFRRVDPNTQKIIGEELAPGTEFSMSWQANVKTSISDGVLVLKRKVAIDFFNTRTLELICLSGVPLNAMTKNHKLVAGDSEPFWSYHRDNPESQTNQIKISNKTVFTYAKYIDDFDVYYLRRPWFWIRHLIATIKFSILVYRDPAYHHRFIKSRWLRLMSYCLIPAGVIRYLTSKKPRVISFDPYDFSSLNELQSLYVGPQGKTK
jgi:glycosyltransferase involved in cell wall biosynthesis